MVDVLCEIFDLLLLELGYELEASLDDPVDFEAFEEE